MFRRSLAHQASTTTVRALLAAAAATVALVASAAHPALRAETRTTELPTEWRLSPPTDAVRGTGTLPESATPTADGRRLVVVDGGAGPAEIQVLDATTLALERTVPMKGAYGVPLADRKGDGLWLSTGGSGTIVHFDAATGAIDRSVTLPEGAWASSIARSPDGATLAVSDELGARLVFVDEAAGTVVSSATFGAHLADAAYAPDGKTVYVANWGGASVFAVDAATHAVRGEIAVGAHPEHLVLSPDGTKLYVSETDAAAIGVIDVAAGRLAKTIPVALFDGKLGGVSPTSLALDASGARLYIACSAANAVAVIATGARGGEPSLAGAIPTGWYPTFVGLDGSGRTLYVANGMGESGRANPQYHPFMKRSPANTGYIAASMIGSIRRLPVPDDASLAAGLSTVREDGGPFLSASLADPGTLAHGPPAASPGATIVRAGGPIQHVIYVVKENRTYDQVLGDLAQADGDASLTSFGAAITPNEHAIARRFGIFDRTFADAEVSADGHNWSMAAFANDYLEKMWPPGYGDRRKLYDFEDGATASVPQGGYLWNSAKRAGITLRNYGEFTTEPKERATAIGEKGAAQHGGDITSSMPDLAGETDPRFTGFDLGVSDLARVAEWKREYDGYVASRTMPSIEVVRLPNDHTAGTRAGELAPKAFVAQNDDAVGSLVQTVSHSAYWSSTAIFILEDDAQNGADHVDAQRMTFYLASPYAAGGVQHAHYTTAGVLRTIEMFFGLPPMSAYDAAARPLAAAFVTKPDLTPYDARPETQDESQRNAATAYHARINRRFDLSRADAFPAAEMNDELAHAARPRLAR